MKKNKLEMIFIIIVVIIAILIGLCKIVVSYMIKEDDEIKIIDGENKLVEHMKSTEDNNKKEKQVQLLLEGNKITEEEAKEILGE